MIENDELNQENKEIAETGVQDASNELSEQMQERWARRAVSQESEASSEQEHSDAGVERVPIHKRAFFKKLCYALISLVIAITIWGYVLMQENPLRIKRIDHVRLSFEGGSEADLKSRNLIVTGDIGSVLPDVSVNVRTYLNELPRFNSASGDIVTATVSLNGIRSPGTYQLRVSPSTSIGSIDSVEPTTVTINVENYVTRSIPVTCAFSSSLPDGYWREEQPMLEWSSISVSGAESEINKIVQACCFIDLANRRESINESFDIVLLDDQQNIVDPANLVVSARYTTVKLNILPCVDIPLTDYITTVGTLGDDYEIASIDINPSSITVAAPEDLLQDIPSAVYLEPINVEDLTPGTNAKTVSLMGLPSGATALTDTNFIVTIEVADKIIQRSIQAELLPLNIIGTNNSRYMYSYSTKSFTVSFNGPASTLAAISTDDFILTLDVSSLTVGSHTVRPKVEFKHDPSWVHDGTVTVRVSSATCTVSTTHGTD